MLQHRLYKQDIEVAGEAAFIPWNDLQGKTILIAGATGMISKTLIDIIMYRNDKYGDQIKIVAVSRNEEKAKERLKEHWNAPYFSYLSHDVNQEMELGECNVDYVLHAASNTHPRAYANDPIGTITANVIGTTNLLEVAVKQRAKFVFFSSVEIYGENRGDVEEFEEEYLGYINSNTLRAGYPESKRLGEALCQAYIKQHGIEAVIPRISRVYGPTMLESDSKALAQFIRKAVNKEDIVLKSEGNQEYSYTYVVDMATALLVLMLKGENGMAYNIADRESNCLLKTLANTLAEAAGKKVVFETPDAVEAAGYSTATKAILNADKLYALGWEAKTHIIDGLTKTVRILQQEGK